MTAHRRWGIGLRELVAPEAAALDLAVFRITMAVVIAMSASVAVADQWAELPVEARTAPLGVGWLLPHLPIDASLVRGARWLLYGACLTGGLGLLSRASFALASALLAYVLLAPQLGGAVFHDHHLLWFSLLLAASPCGDALSVDAWIARRAGRPRPTQGRAHGAAIRCAWILVGLVFFFPGVHKLATSGLAWITTDNLRNQMWWKWAQDPATQPSLRIDRYPLLLRAAAGLTVLFELSFLPLVFVRRTRALAVAGALAFHAATDLFMGIDFSVLWACYTVFVPWRAVGRRLHFVARDATERASDASLVPVGVVGGLVALGVFVAGAAGATQAYPFACYPTFEWMADDGMPALAIELEDADGRRWDLDPARYRARDPRAWAFQWRLAGVYDDVDEARIDAWWDAASESEPLRREVEGAARVRFHRVMVSVDPDRRGVELERTEIYVRDR